MVWGERGDADRCRLGWWGEDKGRVVSKWAASPSPTSVSRHSPLSPALHPLPTQLHPFIKEPMGTRKLIVRPGIFAPCCRADLLTPVPLPSAHHSSSLPSPAHPEWMQFLWIGQCVVNSLDSAPGGFYPWDVTNPKWSMLWLDELQQNSSGVPANDELICSTRLIICYNNVSSRISAIYL